MWSLERKMKDVRKKKMQKTVKQRNKSKKNTAY